MMDFEPDKGFYWIDEPDTIQPNRQAIQDMRIKFCLSLFLPESYKKITFTEKAMIWAKLLA